MTSGPDARGAYPLLRYLLYLGTVGFGGPIALVGSMQRDLVEGRRLVTPSEFSDGLALAQLAPGPLAAQLAMYLGWIRGGAAGATLAGIAFVAPSFLMVLGLSAAYARYGGLPWMAGAFHGIGASVIAIIGRSAARLARVTLGTDALLWIVCGVCAAVTAVLERELPALFIACGLVVALRQRPISRMGDRLRAAIGTPLPGLALLGLVPADAPLRLFAYFAEAGLFVFGSGLAIVPFLHGGVVLQYHWLTERQFLDAVAISMVTPGPAVITVAFIGFMVAGTLGAVVAALGVFAPVWLVVLLCAPYFRRVAAYPAIGTFVRGVTAAATGAIAGAAIVLGRRAIVDASSAALCAGTLIMLSLPVKIPEALVVLVAGVVGVLALR
jgi:chromate transporter